MRQQLLFSILATLGVLGTPLFASVANAQDANSFVSVSSIVGVNMIPSKGSYTVSVDAGAYYMQNGSKHSIQGVIGVYELFSHPTSSPLPSTNPFVGGGIISSPPPYTANPPVVRGLLSTEVARRVSVIFDATDLLAIHSFSVDRSEGVEQPFAPYAWNFKASNDGMAFGYEASDKSLAILPSGSLSPFIFTKGSPIDGFNILGSNGSSIFIKNQSALIPEGSSRTGFCCLIALGSLSLLRRRVSISSS